VNPKGKTMANDFMKLTANNQKQSQIDALKKIGNSTFGVNGGRIVMNGTNLSVFQGDVENFKKSGLGNYGKEQLETIFGALDVNGDGDLSMDEIQSFAALGSDEANIIEDDKNIIDESDFAALYDMAQDYVEQALEEEDTPAVQNQSAVNNSDLYDNSLNTTKVDSSKETASNKAVQTEQDGEPQEQNSITATLSNNEASALAAELRVAMKGLGTDEKTVNNILLERGYNSADIVKIMDAFEQQYGETLMSDIQGDFSGKDETALREVLYAASEEQALQSLGWKTLDDIPSDIVQKANEYYTELESNNALGYMSKFNNLPDSEKSQILLACDLLHKGESAMSRLTEGMVWFGNEDKYVNNIITAMKNTAKTTK